jgi:hypothetical protein
LLRRPSVAGKSGPRSTRSEVGSNSPLPRSCEKFGRERKALAHFSGKICIAREGESLERVGPSTVHILVQLVGLATSLLGPASNCLYLCDGTAHTSRAHFCIHLVMFFSTFASARTGTHRNLSTKATIWAHWKHKSTHSRRLASSTRDLNFFVPYPKWAPR